MATAAVSVPRNEQPPVPAAEPNRRRTFLGQEVSGLLILLMAAFASPVRLGSRCRQLLVSR